MKKRILSIVLAICMVLTLVPTMAFAETAGGTYTMKAGTQGATAASLFSHKYKWSIIQNEGSDAVYVGRELKKVENKNVGFPT